MKQKIELRSWEIDPIEVEVRTELEVRKEAYSVEILGYQGEKSITIISTSRQDGKISYVVVKTAVDDVTVVTTPSTLCTYVEFPVVMKEIIEEAFN